MAITCFFCQNLLSDFIEGILPASRHEELKAHLKSCRTCKAIQEEVSGTVTLLAAQPNRQPSAELGLKIHEAASHGGSRLARRSAIRWGALTMGPLLIIGGLFVSFPELFPWFQQWRQSRDEAQFVRYFPLLRGGSEIIDDQAEWLQLRDPFMKSVWEEGGMSSDEFEKNFQPKAPFKP